MDAHAGCPRQLTGYSEAGHRAKRTAASLQLKRFCTCFHNSCAPLPPRFLRQGTFILKHKSEDAAVVHFNTAFVNAQLPGSTQTQPSTSGETKQLFAGPGRVKDLLFPGAALRISGGATREFYSASPRPLAYAPSTPPFHTVMAQDRDTFLPACRTLLPGWSHAECTHCSSCCPQGASPGNRIWASESM